MEIQKFYILEYFYNIEKKILEQNYFIVLKQKNKTMILFTDDDIIILHRKYEYKFIEYFNEKYKEIRYNGECIRKEQQEKYF